MLQFTILSENTVKMNDLLAEWGLSIFIKTEKIKILYDCGKSITAAHNAQRIGINLNEIDVILLSHSHYDHTGGLLEILSRINKEQIDIIVHPQIWAERYNRSQGEKDKFMGILFRSQQIDNYGAKFRYTTKPLKITRNILTSGEIPMITNFECFDTNIKRLMKKDNKFIPDYILDEQAIFIQTKEGLIVLTACAHRGIINTLYHAQNITGEKRIYAVIGGIHLLHSSIERIEKTIELFKKLNIQRLYLGHCTGLNAITLISHEFGERFFGINTGTIIEFL